MSYVPGAQVPQTSLAERDHNLTTVEFFRFTLFGQTAYQKGQRAGFSEEQAQRIVKNGLGRIVGRAGQ